MNDRSALDRFLHTDDRDVGCDQAMEILHVFAELATTDAEVAAERYADVAAHRTVGCPVAAEHERPQGRAATPAG